MLYVWECERSCSYVGCRGDHCIGCLLFPDSEPDINQQCIGAGDHSCALCAASGIECYHDPECSSAGDRISDLWERIWREDSIYQYFTAALFGSLWENFSGFSVSDRKYGTGCVMLYFSCKYRTRHFVQYECIFRWIGYRSEDDEQVSAYWTGKGNVHFRDVCSAFFSADLW